MSPTHGVTSPADSDSANFLALVRNANSQKARAAHLYALFANEAQFVFGGKHAVPHQVTPERPLRAARGRVFGNPMRGREHPTVNIGARKFDLGRKDEHI